MPKKWIMKDTTEPDISMVESTGSRLLAQLVIQKGIDTPQKAKTFLDPYLFEPVSPYAFKDMEKAVLRIKKAIDEKQHIVICGDFDADGVTSTAVLYKV